MDDPIRYKLWHLFKYVVLQSINNQPLPIHPNLQPVTWGSLGLMAVTGAGLVYYYQVEKEKKQQEGP
jgi:hypothetical protein